MDPIAVVTTPGMGEMIVIALILVLLFGAKKLPELGGAIGKSIKSFKQGVEDEGDTTAQAGATPADEAGAPVSRGDGS